MAVFFNAIGEAAKGNKKRYKKSLKKIVIKEGRPN